MHSVCQSVIRNIVHRFMCRLNSSSNYILNDNLTSSLMFRIRKHWNKLLYVNSWLWILCCVPNVNIWTQIHTYWIYGPCWVRNKVIQLNWNEYMLRATNMWNLVSTVKPEVKLTNERSKTRGCVGFVRTWIEWLIVWGAAWCCS